MVSIVAALGLSALLFCASMKSTSTEEYAAIADLDYCGQSCPSSCEEAEDEYAVCRCDSECERYGDCCSPPSGRLNCTGGEQRAQQLAGLQCRSIHLDSRTQPDRMEAFWMVSACPENWPANQDNEVLREVEEKCRYGRDTLPPVTDLDSGVIYKNEYCAVCHHVASIQPWGYRFGCSPCLETMIADEGINLTHEIIKEECIPCGFYVPETGPLPRHCFHDSLVVGECLTREVLEERTGLGFEERVYRDIVTQCQTGPLRPVAANPCDDPPIYRNQHCAICNAEKTADLQCANPYDSRKDWDFCLRDAERCFNDSETYDNVESNMSTIQPTDGSREKRQNNDCPPPVQEPPPSSFTLFFDVRGSSGVLTSSNVSTTVDITISCSNSQVFDPIYQMCRLTLCPEAYATQGSCAIAMCGGELFILHESEFELLDNDTLLFHNDTFEIVGYNGSSPIICSNFTQNLTNEGNVILYSLDFLAYVSLSISTVACIVILVTHALFKELRTLPGQILMNMISAILATCLCIMIGDLIVWLTEKVELCEAAAIFLNLLVLSHFCWLNIMGFEMLRTFYKASRLHPVEDKSKKNKLFVLYLIIGWGIPIVVTLITVIVNYTTDLIQYGDESCWIGHVPFKYILFVAPVALSIAFNAITFIIIFILLFKSSKAQAKPKNISYLRVCLCVFSITGLTWIFGCLNIAVTDDWIWYTFLFLTSIQEVCIAVAFILTQKVGGLYKKLIIQLLNYHPITSCKTNTKKHTQKLSLETKPAKKKGSPNVITTPSTSAQDDANIMEHRREGE